MKKWIQKMTGLALGAFLAVSLNGKANAAELGDAPLPDPSPYEIEEPITATDPAVSDDASAEVESYNVGDSGAGSSDSTATLSLSAPEAGTAISSVTEDTTADQNDPSPDDPSSSGDSLQENENAQEVSILNVVLDENGEETSTYVAVNYDGPNQVLSSDSDITLLAAGLNRLASIVSGGDVNIGGTGILLVDEIRLGINGFLNFLSSTDLYGENGGSVAVFTKVDAEEDTYRCINGSVPGILDEEYTVEGVKLILSDGCQLILNCNGAAISAETGEVTYYNNSNIAEIKNSTVDYSSYEETNGCLIIGSDAELLVESGAGITCTNMSSMNSHGVGRIIPEIRVIENGSLEVNGEVTGGKISVGDSASLSGTGSIGSPATVSSPACLNECTAVFSNTLRIGGSGTLDSLHLQDCHLFVGNGTTIDNLTSSGSSYLTVSGSARLNAPSISGTLEITKDTGDIFGEDIGTVELCGMISGGTLNLSSGRYMFLEDCTLNGESAAVVCNGVIVYDYSDAGVMRGSIGTAPLVMAPESVTPIDPDSHSIPIQILLMNQVRHMSGYVTASVSDVGMDTYSTDHEGSDVILSSELYSMAAQLAENYSGNGHPYMYGVELAYLEDGILRTAYLDPGQDDLPVDNIYLIRIICIYSVTTGQGGGSVSRTSTTFTGTGVLGGANAGSVRYGTLSFDLSNCKAVTPTESTDPENTDPGSNDTGDNDHGSTDTDRFVESATEETVVYAGLRAVVSERDGRCVLEAYDGNEKLQDLGGRKIKARIPFSLPAEWNEKTIYAVFRKADGLAAFCAVYDPVSGTVSFETDVIGEFILICMEYDGVRFSPEFYSALADLPEIQSLF